MIELTGSGLTLEQFAAVVRGREACKISDPARQALIRSRRVIERLEARAMEGDPVYGVNTGFGDLARVRIPQDQLRVLQERLVMSHAAGVGEPLPSEAVRGMLLLRANALAKGFSGVRAELVDFLLDLLNQDLLPVVPSRGSVGASGDLAPLAHLALPVIGRGRLRFEGEEMLAAEGLRRCGLAPVGLEPKEGLALINGTQAMSSLLALAVLEVRRQVKVADLVGALSAEALLGTDTPFQARIHELRPHPGQKASAANLWYLMRDSGLRESHRQHDPRVQDPYSVRCMPQVHGAVRDVLRDAERRLEIEMNAVTDNPLVFAEDDEILSGGNFHGEPIAMAADSLAVAAAELGSISERRTDKLTDAVFSGLPPFLTEEPGLNSGFMIGQVTAAALVSENKTLAHPASVDSIPTSAEKEDHVSMGMWAALKLGQVVRNVDRILGIELLAAAQGIDLRRPLQPGPHLQRLHESIRVLVPRWEEDRELGPDLAIAEAFLVDDIETHINELE
jgi:histidine ammonia-lyase